MGQRIVRTHVTLSAISGTISARNVVRDRDRGTVRARGIAGCRIAITRVYLQFNGLLSERATYLPYSE